MVGRAGPVHLMCIRAHGVAFDVKLLRKHGFGVAAAVRRGNRSGTNPRYRPTLNIGGCSLANAQPNGLLPTAETFNGRARADSALVKEYCPDPKPGRTGG
jgi:hypothetical protein